MLVLDAFLSFGGIVVAVVFFVFATDRQQRITEQLFEHPFSVVDTASDLKLQVIGLRARMLTLAVHEEPDADARADVLRRRARIDADLANIDRYYLGDHARVGRMQDQIGAWYREQDRILADVQADRARAARFRMGHDAEALVDQITADCDAVLAFARDRAATFVREGQERIDLTVALVVGGAVVIALAHAAILVARTRAKRTLFEQLYSLATIDPLTQCRNRRALLDAAEGEIQRVLRLEQGLALIALDLDHFKAINDEHGHAAGDAVLQAFAAACRAELRQIDTLGRIGGEEFAVLLPGATAADAGLIAERIRAATSRLRVRHAGVELALTVSAGVAQWDPWRPTIDSLMQRADAALYEAKRTGRDRVVIGPVGSADPGSPLAAMRGTGIEA